MAEKRPLLAYGVAKQVADLSWRNNDYTSNLRVQISGDQKLFWNDSAHRPHSRGKYEGCIFR